MISLEPWLHAFVGLFYPNLCLACSENLPPGQELICLSCQFRLPKTHYHQQDENPFTERFWGRVPLRAGAALYHYSKGGAVQQLIHALKYHNKPAIGYQLGRMYGREVRESGRFPSVDVLVPVPLHPRKAHQRGYNQAEQFGRGLAESLEVPQYAHALRRRDYAASQTQKSRRDRVANVLEAFALNQPERVAGKHVLLVDDVLTTGATLEACALRLLETANTTVSMLTLAIASD